MSEIEKNNYKDWREASLKSQNGRKIREAIKNQKESMQHILEDQVKRNAELIKTIPEDIAYRVNKMILEKSIDGVRSEELVEEVKKLVPNASDVVIRRICRTEVSKTNELLTQVKAQNLGINWYVWDTSQDGERVRKSHRIMQGVLCNYNDPPSPEELAKEKNVGKYNPGGIYNCRCTALPLTDIDDVEWPHKVHFNSKIQVMSKKRFKEISGITE